MISLNFYYYPQLNFEYNRIGDYSADNLSTAIISSTTPEIGGGDLENWSNIDYEEVYDRAEEFLIQQLSDEELYVECEFEADESVVSEIKDKLDEIENKYTNKLQSIDEQYHYCDDPEFGMELFGVKMTPDLTANEFIVKEA